MHLFYILFLLVSFATAAPTSSTTSHTPTLSNSPSHSPSTSAHRNTSSRIPHIFTTHAQSIQILTRPALPTRSRESPFPIHTRPPPPPPPFAQARHSQKPISIAFEVLGGLFASLIFFSVVRCCYNYKKTPHRDRIADILHRHNLQRELEELERNPAAIRRPSLREPAPPYFPRPPSYDEMVPPQPVRTAPHAEYSAVSMYSPPPSPPMSQRILPGSTSTAPTHPINPIPQMPSG
ncbi:hypothetical protein GALMADRAFT_133286 [Galerina marginata CBS 339.88]|uniref:Uncharacterized protein n=1 Tax=Galerina marginata (strain CBS 339.88) TaxID=685588 RepID=A0A067TVB9_GALM3|nr:hypothetical protein GALMADRAFT_133286 [Galerina marginata CBS 339.88]